MMKVRDLGAQDYMDTWPAMQDYTATRTAVSADEIWVVEHFPVYTLGLNGRREHIHSFRDRDVSIPVIATDRGGQVTYHGPGQVVLYVLLDLGHYQLGIKDLVSLLEQSVIDLLVAYGFVGERRVGAPGVYVAGEKIAALGLRIRRNCSYHGLSFNIDMDLSPFNAIDPCGFSGLAVTQFSNHVQGFDKPAVIAQLVDIVTAKLTASVGVARQDAR